MKAFRIFLPCLIGMATLVVSCTLEKTPENSGISLSVDDFIPDEEGTRTTCNPSDGFKITWASGDVIGIFPKEGYQEPFAIPASQVGNSSATFDGGYWSIKDGLQYGAYYPFDVENFKTAEEKTHIPVSYSDQQQTGTTCGLGAYDYTYTDWKTATDGSVSFQFHHIGAFVEFSLVLPATATYTKLEATVSDDLIPLKGTYDMTASTVAFVADESTKTSTMQVTLNDYEGTAGETALIYMMLPPVDLSEETILITLTTSAGTKCTYKANKKKNFRAGYYYRIGGDPRESDIEGTTDNWNNAPQSVDLGLGVNWATFNVGAKEPNELGNYFAWGEVETKDTYSWNNYKWGKEGSISKYSCKGGGDWKSYLDLEDDAANVSYGSDWRIPSQSDWNRLALNCNWIWTEEDGVYGYRITSKVSGYQDKSIFIPAGYDNTNTANVYWTNQLNDDIYTPEKAFAFCVSSDEGYTRSIREQRYNGYCIRPVEDLSKYITGLTLDKDSVILNVNTPTAVIVPTVATTNPLVKKDIIWASSNTDIVEVDSHGTITAISMGKATITATTVVGELKKTCTVIVEPLRVDLGLSSGTKWASCNLGASKPEECGDSYAWGEIETKDSYTISNYRFYKGFTKPYEANQYYQYSKYVTDYKFGTIDNIVTLQPQDDVATVILGEDWHIPTKEQFQELIDECSWEVDEDYAGSVYGLTATGPNGCSIYLPVTDDDEDGYYVGLYSSSLESNENDFAYVFLYRSDVSKGNIFVTQCLRRASECIRPVCK